MAIDAGTSPSGMMMAITYAREAEEYATETTPGIGSYHEGEALTLLLRVKWLAARPGT